MRIISGVHKGRKLVAPKKLSARPTTDMAKEGLFNVLNNRVSFQNTTVLDLFSGTGNISFEFSSRGCTSITAIEQDRVACSFIRKTAEELGLEGLQVHCAKVDRFIQSTASRFDLIFMDPPYALGVEGYEKVITSIFERGLLIEDGILVAEHFSKYDLSAIEHFEEVRTYSSSAFSFFKK